MKTLSGRMCVHGLVIVCLAVSSSGALAAAPEVKVLWDFESPDWHQNFRVEHVTLELSKDHVSQGEASLKATFAGRGVSQHRLIRVNLGRMGGLDWRGWDALEFDVYNPGAKEVHVEMGFYGKGGVITKPSFAAPPGWSRYAMFTRRSRIDRFLVAVRDGNPNERVLYIDHIRLVKRLPGRLRELKATLENLQSVPGDQAEALKQDLDAPAELRRRVVWIERTLAAADADQYETISKEVDVLERQIRATAGAITRPTILALAARMVPEELASDRFGLMPQPTATQPQVLGLEALRDILARELQQARLQAGIAEHFADAEFAIGIPDYPVSLYDRPRTYAGPLGKEVTLAAARKEYEPFQLVLLPKDKPMTKVQITASALTGPGMIAAKHVEIAPMGWQWIPKEERWLATMLRPDIKVFDVASDIQQPVWVNVYVPEQTPPGEYHGTITISAKGMRSQQVTVKLTVWPFALPKYPAMKSAGAWPLQIYGDLSADQYDAYVRFLIAHRWNPHRLYMSKPVPYATMKRWNEWGGTFFNLFWLNHKYRRGQYEKGEDGQLRPTQRALDGVFQKLDPVINRIKQDDPEFLQHCVLYGFDEPGPGEMPLLENWFRILKERYGPELKTYFATHRTYYREMWEAYGISEYIDTWALMPGFMTYEELDRLHKAGKEILVYNIRASYMDLVVTRLQFWAYFKDRIDGVLHYNPHYSSEGIGSTRMQGPWEATLFPTEKKRTDGGIWRLFPGEGTPRMSTTIFEYWREGLEDVDYLYLLRDLRDRLAAVADDDNPAHTRLLRQADRMLNVPENLTEGVLEGRARASGDIIRAIRGSTNDMHVILQARREVAALIVAIQEQLPVPP